METVGQLENVAVRNPAFWELSYLSLYTLPN